MPAGQDGSFTKIIIEQPGRGMMLSADRFTTCGTLIISNIVLWHEGKEDKFWSKVNLENIEFNILYDLQAFFEEFSELKISSIAERAGLNPSLVRQYATGNKYPSADQARKIEEALHGLGKKLQQVAICAS